MEVNELHKAIWSTLVFEKVVHCLLHEFARDAALAALCGEYRKVKEDLLREITDATAIEHLAEIWGGIESRIQAVSRGQPEQT